MPLLTRIESARHSVTSLEKKRVGDLNIRTFANGTIKRLDDLSNAVQATSALPASRREEAQKSISHTLQSIEQELFEHLGVTTK